MPDFRNFGHAIAAGAKKIVTFAQDAGAILSKIGAHAPEAALVLSALNPKAAQYSDMAFHVLGDVAAALEKAGAAGGQNGLNVQMDIETINAVKAIIAEIKGVTAAAGKSIPPVA